VLKQVGALQGKAPCAAATGASVTVTRTEDKAATQGAFIGISKAIIDMGMTDIYQVEIAPVTFEATQTAPAIGATPGATKLATVPITQALLR
jgi:hypothetical protein